MQDHKSAVSYVLEALIDKDFGVIKDLSELIVMNYLTANVFK